MGIMCSGLRVEATPLTVPTRLHLLPPRGTATHAGVVLMMETKGHASGARRVEGTGITDLRPLADSLDTYARQIHSIAEIVRVQLEMLEARSIEEESAEQSTEAKADENTAPCSPHAEFCSIAHNLSGIHSIARASAAFRAPETRWQIASGLIVSTARRALRLPGFYPTRASDGKLLLAPKVIAAVIGIVGIPLLIFSFGQIKPFGSAAHLAIQNQKGLTIGQWSTPEPYSAPPAEQTEPTPGPTPATSGRAELTPAPPPPRRINWRRNRGVLPTEVQSPTQGGRAGGEVLLHGPRHDGKPAWAGGGRHRHARHRHR